MVRMFLSCGKERRCVRPVFLGIIDFENGIASGRCIFARRRSIRYGGCRIDFDRIGCSFIQLVCFLGTAGQPMNGVLDLAPHAFLYCFRKLWRGRGP